MGAAARSTAARAAAAKDPSSSASRVIIGSLAVIARDELSTPGRLDTAAGCMVRSLMPHSPDAPGPLIARAERTMQRYYRAGAA